jgi:hypothetical protein
MGKGQAESREDWLIRIKLALLLTKLFLDTSTKSGESRLKQWAKAREKARGTTFETKTDPLGFLSRFSPNQIGLLPAVICGHLPHLGVNPYSSKITSELPVRQGVIAITSHKPTSGQRRRSPRQNVTAGLPLIRS